MRELDWGPIPRLAECLRLNQAAVPLAWLDRLGQAGHPWRHVARDLEGGFWPASLTAGAAAAASRSPWWRRLLAGPTPASTVKEADLAGLLASCHAWLATENIRCLAPRLAPDPRACHPCAGLTSERGLVWSLIAFDAWRHGPGAIQGQDSLLQKALLDKGAAPGDMLALHRDVERLAEAWLEDAGLSAEPLPAGARVGGLRTSTFIRATAVLPPGRRKALLSLAACSPLTWFAYFDRFGEAPAWRVFPLLRNMLLPCAQAGGASGVDAWSRDAWLALLANTLLGALLSAPPDLGAWKHACARLDEIRAEHSRKGAFERWLLSGQLGDAEELEKSLKERAVLALLARLEAWRAIADSSFGRELQVLTLDRLTRLAAVRVESAKGEEWRRASAPAGAPGQESALASYYEELGRLVLAAPRAGFYGMLTEERKQALRDDLEVLLSPHVDAGAGPRSKFWNPKAKIHMSSSPSGHDKQPYPAEAICDVLAYLVKGLPKRTVRMTSVSTNIQEVSDSDADQTGYAI